MHDLIVWALRCAIRVYERIVSTIVVELTLVGSIESGSMNNFKVNICKNSFESVRWADGRTIDFRALLVGCGWTFAYLLSLQLGPSLVLTKFLCFAFFLFFFSLVIAYYVATKNEIAAHIFSLNFTNFCQVIHVQMISILHRARARTRVCVCVRANKVNWVRYARNQNQN